jgi:glycerophosphoryl diester phosphodiesterase
MTNNNPDIRTSIPILVAHRGYASRYPENTLPACEAALQAGACFIEIDVQLTADGIPVLFHDHNLLRTTGHDALITNISSHFLRTLDAGERQRLGNAGTYTPAPTLNEFVDLLRQWPQAQAFVEIKEESLATFGHDRVLHQVLNALTPLKSRCIPISYDTEILQLMRNQGSWKTGWVIHQYDAEHRDQALSLAPDYLICNYRKTGSGPLWNGPWQWVLYEVTQASLALQLHQRGAQMIETMAIGDLLQDKDLNAATCQTDRPD